MKQYNNYIGIDVSKRTLDICVLRNMQVIFERRVDNSPRTLAKLVASLKKKGVLAVNTLVCCEHTGVYTKHLLSWSVQYSFNLWLEKALQIKKSVGMQRGKNDKVDAERIATYASRYADQSVIYEPPKKEILELKHLIALRNRLLKVKKQFEVPLKELKTMGDMDGYKCIEKETLSVLKNTKKNLKKVEKKIKETLKRDDRIARIDSIIQSVDNMGLMTSAVLIMLTNEFKKSCSAGSIGCFAGTVPFKYTSGSSVQGKARVSHLAAKMLKKMLHLCALRSINSDGKLKAYYLRKVAEGKNKMSVLNAIRHKLLKIVCACVRDDRKYEKNYVKNLAVS